MLGALLPSEPQELQPPKLELLCPGQSPGQGRFALSGGASMPCSGAAFQAVLLPTHPMGHHKGGTLQETKTSAEFQPPFHWGLSLTFPRPWSTLLLAAALCLPLGAGRGALSQVSPRCAAAAPPVPAVPRAERGEDDPLGIYKPNSGVHVTPCTDRILELDSALKMREDKAPTGAWPRSVLQGREGDTGLRHPGSAACARVHRGLPLI